MSFAMHGCCGVGVWGVDQAEDLAMVLVDPVAQVVDAVCILGLQVGGVCLRHVVDGDRALDRVRVHEQCHRLSSPVCVGLPPTITGNLCRAGRCIGCVPYLGGMIPSRRAVATALGRVGSPSLRSTAETWWPTVFSDRMSRSATSA